MRDVYTSGFCQSMFLLIQCMSLQQMFFTDQWITVYSTLHVGTQKHNKPFVKHLMIVSLIWVTSCSVLYGFVGLWPCTIVFKTWRAQLLISWIEWFLLITNAISFAFHMHLDVPILHRVLQWLQRTVSSIDRLDEKRGKIICAILKVYFHLPLHSPCCILYCV